MGGSEGGLWERGKGWEVVSRSAPVGQTSVKTLKCHANIVHTHPVA